jgi:3-hydroxyisobutyrate dehydrogenase-like beta-hydroxyacid dehydrogenase
MTICLIGYGIIGKAWRPHLISDGHKLRVWNRTPQDIPEYYPDLTLASRAAEIIHIVVADPAAVSSVLDQIEANLNQEVLVIQSSTISPRWGQSFHDRVTARGARYVEAPFTGSKLAAENRQNVFYLGGQPAVIKQAQAYLKTLSKITHHVGSVQQACAVKLAMNLQIAAIGQALTESLSFARSYGLSDSTYFDLLESNVARSGLSDLKKPKLCHHDYSPQFSVKHMHKDLALALDSCPPQILPLTRSVLNLYQQGLNQGLGEEDFTALIKLLEPKA